MAIEHVARCDGPDCTDERPVTVNDEHTVTVGSTEGGESTSIAYSLPPRWKEVEGKTFCSWRCLSAYAVVRG